MTKGKYSAICQEECCKFALCDLDDMWIANGAALTHHEATGHRTFLFTEV